MDSQIMNSHLSSSSTLGKAPPLEASSNYDFFFFCPLSCLLVEGHPTFTGTRGAGFHTCRRASISVSGDSQPQNLPGEWGLARNLHDGSLGRGSLQRDILGRTQRTLCHSQVRSLPCELASPTLLSTCLS